MAGTVIFEINCRWLQNSAVDTGRSKTGEYQSCSRPGDGIKQLMSKLWVFYRKVYTELEAKPGDGFYVWL